MSMSLALAKGHKVNWKSVLNDAHVASTSSDYQNNAEPGIPAMHSLVGRCDVACTCAGIAECIN